MSTVARFTTAMRPWTALLRKLYLRKRSRKPTQNRSCFAKYIPSMA